MCIKKQKLIEGTSENPITGSAKYRRHAVSGTRSVARLRLVFHLNRKSLILSLVQSCQKAQYLATVQEAQAPSNVKLLVMYDTKHFVMYHRPLKLDCIIQGFISGKELVDFAPETSEYLEDEQMN